MFNLKTNTVMKTVIQCPSCNNFIPEVVLNKFKNSIQQESLLAIKTKEKLISDLKDQLSKIRLKLENSSQQMTGEIQELFLEDILASTFTTDLIEPVAKGMNGADCSQHVKINGITIGKILYESKRVATFNNDWIDKLKKDNLQAKCDVLVIVTSKMPNDIPGKYWN